MIQPRVRLLLPALLLAALTGSACAAPLTADEVRAWRDDLGFLRKEMPARHANLFHTMTAAQFDSALGVRKLSSHPAMRVAAWAGVAAAAVQVIGLLRWPVKLLLPVGFFLMALQGVSEIIKRIAALEHVIDIEFKYEKPLQ